MGQGAVSKPVVKWWLSLNSSTRREVACSTRPTRLRPKRRSCRPALQRTPRRRSAHSAAQVRHKCGTSAAQVRHKCGTSAEQVRGKCGASAEQVRSTVRIACGTPADVRRGVFWQKHPPKNTKTPPKAQKHQKRRGGNTHFFSPSGLFAGTRADPLRNGGGTGAAPVRHRCGTGADRVRNAGGTLADLRRGVLSATLRVTGNINSSKTAPVEDFFVVLTKLFMGEAADFARSR